MPYQPFSGIIPEGFLYDTRYDMWVQERAGQNPDEILIGITAFGLFLAGEIIAFTGKPKGAEVDFGRGLGTVESRKTVLAVHAPCSFRLLEVNESLEERPALINRDPYSAWLVRGQPRDWNQERGRLVDAATYREHVVSIDPEARFT